MDNHPAIDAQSKERQLAPFTEDHADQYLTTEQGVRVSDTKNSLHAGARGPTLLEDFHFREKITHFDHERIPERIVHARGAGAFGYFQAYELLADLTTAGFLQDPAVQTPVFVRFSTVAGSRGSADTVRDVRGFATKFYTAEGNFDLVGNNMPIFFIQDGIQFPDLVHSFKPEPHNEMPQASTAHDNFWDFISLVPESMHMIMWAMSDRAIPRSFRMMEGFGIHTFRFVNAAGKGRFVKFHWKPLLGMHSLLWDESLKLTGADPDWLRRDLWEAIEQGDYPEFEFGVQVIEESDEFAFDFDLLDPTKLVPEELVPVRKIGKMVLNRNPDNFFAEVEQAAFHPGNVVPGIDFSNDPLLQARLFSYQDTQLSRLGGPNFAEIPVNRPLPAVHNNQQDGHMRQTINRGRVNYFPNSLGRGCPMHAPQDMGGFVHYAEKIEGHKIRARSDSFSDHFGQARLFFASMAPVEQEHIVGALQFELSKVETPAVRQRVVDHLAQIDRGMAARVASAVGVTVPAADAAPVDGGNVGQATVEARRQTGAQVAGRRSVDRSPALSMLTTVHDTIKSRRIAILVDEGFDAAQVAQVKAALEAAGAHPKIVSPILGTVRDAGGNAMPVDMSLRTTPSLLFDAIVLPGGAASVEALQGQDAVTEFVGEAFRHCKPIAALGEGVALLEGVRPGAAGAPGVVTSRAGDDLAAFAQTFIGAIGAHRHWDREKKKVTP